MINYARVNFVGLKSSDEFRSTIEKFLAEGETLVALYSNKHDGVAFTGRRLIIFISDGVGDRKMTLDSIPYSRINLYSVTAVGAKLKKGTVMEIAVNEIPEIKLKFAQGTNVPELNRIISNYIV